MKFTIKVNSIRSIKTIDGYWNNEDYRNLLELFDFSDFQEVPEEELFEMLSMAMSDFEPIEAAEVVLGYKLSKKLNSGQIKNISHEMVIDKIAEEYPDISLHYDLFNINQLLRKAYNGKFPETIVSKIELELTFKGKVNVNKEVVLRTISDLLSEKSLLKRLFSEQLDADEELKDAESIIWELKHLGENRFELVTSDYWMNREDFELDEFSGDLDEDEINH